MISFLSDGQVIPLSLQLFNYNPSKYVKAFITDATDTPIFGSPVELSAAGSLGLYSNNTLLMPDSDFIVVQYIVYDDPAYTVISTSQGGSSDIFILDALSVAEGIPTYLQLFDYRPDKFIKVFVTDEEGVPILGSPAELIPIGSLGLYGSKELLAPASPFVIAQYIVYDDSDYTTISTSEGASSDTFLITEAAGFMNAGNLPFVGDTMLDYFQPMVFTQIRKTVRNFQITERPVNLSFRGVWQPFTAQHLMMKPHGQRQWTWYMVHSDPSLFLAPDEVITYQNVQYRVMDKIDFTRYGYVEYHVIEDYKGSGPN